MFRGPRLGFRLRPDDCEANGLATHQVLPRGGFTSGTGYLIVKVLRLNHTTENEGDQVPKQISLDFGATVRNPRGLGLRDDTRGCPEDGDAGYLTPPIGSEKSS